MGLTSINVSYTYCCALTLILQAPSSPGGAFIAVATPLPADASARNSGSQAVAVEISEGVSIR